MSMLGGILSIGSALLGGLGSHKQAQASENAASGARGMSLQQAYEGMNRLGGAGWGFGNNEDLMTAMRRLTGNKKTDAPILAARARLDAAQPNAYDVATRAGSVYNSAMDAQEGGQRRLTRQLSGLAAGLEGAGGDLEARNAAVINRNADQALRNANQQTQASMSLFGPSTFTAAALAGNARQNAQVRNDALLNNSQQAFGNFANARGNRINLLNSRGNAELALGSQNAAQRYQVAQDPSRLRLGLLGSSPFNPYLGVNTSSYYSAASPSAAAMQSGASGLGTLGGFLMGGGGGGGGSGLSWAGGNMPNWSFA